MDQGCGLDWIVSDQGTCPGQPPGQLANEGITNLPAAGSLQRGITANASPLAQSVCYSGDGFNRRPSQGKDQRCDSGIMRASWEALAAREPWEPGSQKDQGSAQGNPEEEGESINN